MAKTRLLIGADMSGDKELYQDVMSLVKVLDTDMSKFLRSALREKTEKMKQIPEIRERIKAQAKQTKK